MTTDTPKARAAPRPKKMAVADGPAPPDPARSTGPRLRDKEQTARRQLLLTAARRLLRKGGAQAVTMRAVADEVGVSTTVVYGFFQDKATLITQAVDGDLKRFAHHLERAVQEACSPADSLLRVAVAYVTFGTAHPQSYRLMFIGHRKLFHRVRQRKRRRLCTGPRPGRRVAGHTGRAHRRSHHRNGRPDVLGNGARHHLTAHQLGR